MARPRLDENSFPMHQERGISESATDSSLQSRVEVMPEISLRFSVGERLAPES